MPEKTLPFPRGKTWGDGGNNDVTLTDSLYSHLEGQLFEVEDTVHGTGEKVVLRCVKNDTGAAITVARRCAEFSVTDSTDFGLRISTFPADTAGAVAKPLDDAYVVGSSIPDDDLFYIVDSGPCWVNTEYASVSLTAGDAVAVDALGLINGAACAAGEYPVGVVTQASTGTFAGVLIKVNPGLMKPPALG